MNNELSLREVKEHAFSVLQYIKYVCEKNHIFYILSFGTVLGAVRHDGFIPWDDDVDICVFRKDYQRFIEAFIAEKNERFILLSTETSCSYSLPHMKIIDNTTSLYESGKRKKIELGVWVDVFALDNVPNDLSERKKYFKKLEKYQYYWRMIEYLPRKDDNKRIVSIIKYNLKILYAILLGYDSRKWAIKLEKLSQKYINEDTSDVGVLSFFPYNREKGVSPRSLIQNTIMHKFESDFFPIPKDYKRYLKKTYGDYMTLPPIEKRVTHHSYTVVYKDYIKNSL